VSSIINRWAKINSKNEKLILSSKMDKLVKYRGDMAGNESRGQTMPRK
jgi:hypothetical protein